MFDFFSLGKAALKMKLASKALKNREVLPNPVARTASNLSLPPVMIFGSLGVAIAGILWRSPEVSRVGQRAFLSASMACGTSWIVKRIIGRERPDSKNGFTRFHGLTTKDKNMSLPSGHTAAVTAVAGSMPAKLAPTATSAAFAFAALAAASRVHEERHRVSDVLVGGLIGLLSAKVIKTVLDTPAVKTQAQRLENQVDQMVRGEHNDSQETQKKSARLPSVSHTPPIKPSVNR